MNRRIGPRRGPRLKPPVREPSGTQPKPMAVEIEDFEGCPAPISKHIHRPLKRLRSEISATEGNQPVDSFAEVDGLVSQENSKLRNQLDHGVFSARENQRRGG